MSSAEKYARPGLLGAVLFGSRARDDADRYSDKDIAAFYEKIHFQQRIPEREYLASTYETVPSSVCIYSAEGAEQMRLSGSLFFWHMKLEGKVLDDPTGFICALFDHLVPYDGYSTDLAIYATIAADVLKDAEMRPLHAADMHSLFAVCRNVCLLLTHRKGEPAFGRMTSFLRARELFNDLPLTHPLYELLAAGHLAYARGASTGPDPSAIMPLLREVNALLDFAKEKLR